MITLVDRCPFYDRETTAEVGGGKVLIRACQAVVWVSLSARGFVSERFPAVLDTGHSHNFSIREEQLKTWAGFTPEAMELLGSIRVNNRLVLLREAALLLHGNVPGSRDEIRGEPCLQETASGIVVHRSDDPLAARLPILGLRVLARNKLRLVVDGAAMTVSLESERSVESHP
jgi:hypothetical protein